MKAATVLLSDCITSGTVLLLLFFLFKWRIRRKWMLALLLTFSALSCTAYCVAAVFLPWLRPAVSAQLCFLLPGLLLMLPLARYRDMRFWFTFTSINVLSFCVSILTRTAASYLEDGAVLFLVINGIIALSALIGAWRFHQIYWDLLSLLKAKWGLLALISVWFYILLYFATVFPAPVVERGGCFPLLIALCLILMTAYIIIFITLLTLQKYYTNLNHQHEMENELKMQKLYRRMAYHDNLTGLYNRRSFEERLHEKEQKREAICYVALDINDLKLINDTDGHLAGDEAICKNAELLKKCCGSMFRAYRLGGDEFALLSETSDMSALQPTLRHLERTLDALAQERLPASMAMGFSFLTDYQNDSIHSLLVRGDRNMYQHKRQMKGSQN